jgi:hypothetical protein
MSKTTDEDIFDEVAYSILDYTLKMRILKRLEQNHEYEISRQTFLDEFFKKIGEKIYE